jgi:hypothetical protein
VVGREIASIRAKNFSAIQCQPTIPCAGGNLVGDVKMVGPKFLINPVTKGSSAFSRRNCMNQAGLTTEIVRRLGL